MPRPHPIMTAIRQAHAASGLTNVDLSKATGIPKSTLSTLLRTDAPRDLVLLTKILAALGARLVAEPVERAPRNPTAKLLADCKAAHHAAGGDSLFAIQQSAGVQYRSLYRFLQRDAGAATIDEIEKIVALAAHFRLAIRVVSSPR